MPALKNVRQERFCQLVKQGVPPYRAYPEAGYKPDEGAPYRLSGNVRVKRRIAELTRGLAVKTRVTVESLTDELNAIADGAAKSEQWGAAKGAVETKAKLHGLLVERKETGAPGDFAGMTTPEQVLDVIRSELGEDAAKLLATLLNPTRSDVVESEPAQAIEPTSEGSAALN